MPDVGGDTLWVNLQAAYRALAEPIRNMCDQLTAIHHDPFYAVDIEAAGGFFWDGQHIDKLLPALHPVVRVHPESGRRGLFVNENFTKWLLGFSRVESDAILQMLYVHCTRTPEFMCRHRWTQGDVAFWDNRATLHYATDDYGDVLRVVHRVTLRGDKPYGPSSPEAAAREGSAQTVAPPVSEPAPVA